MVQVRLPVVDVDCLANIPPVLGLSGVAVPQSNYPQPSTPQLINGLFGGVPNTVSPPQITSPSIPSYSQPVSKRSARSTPDPFASLASSTPRQASPFQFQQSIRPQNSGSVDLLDVGVPPPSSNLAQSSTSDANDDDEWTFASAVPDTSKDLTVTNTSINAVFNVSRESDTVLLIKSRVSNNTNQPISDLRFQLAASKVDILVLFSLGVIYSLLS